MLSIVIPVFNEADSLAALHRELCEVAAARGYDLDVVFVDDGSTDGSWKVIRQLAEADPRVSGLRFRRNFGKAAALSARGADDRNDFLVSHDAASVLASEGDTAVQANDATAVRVSATTPSRVYAFVGCDPRRFELAGGVWRARTQPNHGDTRAPSTGFSLARSAAKSIAPAARK